MMRNVWRAIRARPFTSVIISLVTGLAVVYSVGESEISFTGVSDILLGVAGLALVLIGTAVVVLIVVTVYQKGSLPKISNLKDKLKSKSDGKSGEGILYAGIAGWIALWILIGVLFTPLWESMSWPIFLALFVGVPASVWFISKKGAWKMLGVAMAAVILIATISDLAIWHGASRSFSKTAAVDRWVESWTADDRSKSTCRLVSSIPPGAAGDFCITKDAGSTITVAPPSYTYTEVEATAPATFRFTDWHGNTISSFTTTDPNEQRCAPNGYIKIHVTLKESGIVRARIGLGKSNTLSHCS